MFYTESITIKSRPTIWSKIVRYFERVGAARAKRELQRLGYTEKYLDSLSSKNLTD